MIDGKGSPSVKLTRDEFRERFRAQFFDPAFERVSTELDAVEAIYPRWVAAHGVAI